MPILPLDFNSHPNNPPAKINSRWYYPFTVISGSSINISASAQGRYSSYFASAEYGKSNHIFEITTVHPVSTDEDGKTNLYGRWIIATLSSAELSMNLSAAIAAATVEASGKVNNNMFKARTRGIDDASWEKLRNLASQINGDNVTQLGEGLNQSLTWIVNDSKKGQSEPAGVLEIVSADWDLEQSVSFALNRIRRGDSLEKAEKYLEDKLEKKKSRKDYAKVDSLTVAAVYHRLNIPLGKAPLPDQEKLARRILRKNAPMPERNDRIEGYWYEVPPYRASDGSLPCLRHISNDPNLVGVHDWPRNPDDLGPSAGHVGAISMRIQAALRTSASSLMDLSTDNDMQFQAYGWSADYVAKGKPNSLILDEKYTVGFRVRTRTLSTSNSLSVTAIAAKASLDLEDVGYEIEVLGMNLGELESLPMFSANAIGKFDVNTLNSIGALYEEASDVINDKNNPNFKPLLTAVKLNLSGSEIQDLVDRGYSKLQGTIDLAESMTSSADSPGIDLLENTSNEGETSLESYSQSPLRTLSLGN